MFIFSPAHCPLDCENYLFLPYRLHNNGVWGSKALRYREVQLGRDKELLPRHKHRRATSMTFGLLLLLILLLLLAVIVGLVVKEKWKAA